MLRDRGGTHMEWRTFAAVWGAGLSTLLALSRIEWPLVSFEPGSPLGRFDAPAWVRIRIMNPSKRSLVVVGMGQVRLRRGSGRIEFFHERDVGSNNDEAGIQDIKFAQRSYDKELRLYVPGEKSAVVRIVTSMADGCHILVFWWHRNWLLGRCLPLFVRVSARRARQINGA
jgi:hypothetical protein